MWNNAPNPRVLRKPLSKFPVSYLINHSMRYIIFTFLFSSILSGASAQTKGKTYTSIAQALASPASVTALNLKGQNLKTLPDISKLVNLESLDLSYNAFTTIPAQLSKLPKLKILNLNNNAFTTLPANLSPLHNITTLRLDANPFAAPVAELKKLSVLTSLTTLNFSANKVSAFPDELLKMTGLTDLDLGYGTIKTLPADIDKLKNLKRLVLTKNLITAFPAAFFKLPRLANLDLSYCDFKALQPEFVNLPLDVLDVSYNKNLTTIPNIKGLRYINIKNTKIDVEKLKWIQNEGTIILN
jgi:leucine-rich repeat protein SHOC2